MNKVKLCAQDIEVLMWIYYTPNIPYTKANDVVNRWINLGIASVTDAESVGVETDVCNVSEKGIAWIGAIIKAAENINLPKQEWVIPDE